MNFVITLTNGETVSSDEVTYEEVLDGFGSKYLVQQKLNEIAETLKQIGTLTYFMAVIDGNSVYFNPAHIISIKINNMIQVPS